MKEFEVYVPLTYNDGSPVEPEKLARIRDRLLRRFRGLTYFPQHNDGFWVVGSITFQDTIVLYRVVTDEVKSAKRFFKTFKEELKKDLNQEEILVVVRDIEVL